MANTEWVNRSTPSVVMRKFFHLAKSTRLSKLG